MDKVKTINKNKADIAYRIRNVLGNTLLSVAAMGFVKQNLQGISTNALWAISVGVVGLVVYFTHSK